MTLDELIKDKPGCYSTESGLAIWEVKNKDFLLDIDMPEVHIQMLIIRGWADVMIGTTRATLQSDTLTDLLHNKLHINEVSDDISVIFIYTTEAYISNFMKNKPPFPVEYVMEKLEQPVVLLYHHQAILIRERIDLLLNLMKTANHYYLEDMLKCALWMVYLEMANIFRHKNEDSDHPADTDSKRSLLMRFIKLIPQHVRRERSVGFYASELCVSCQYLERVVKAISGQTAYQWIQRTLIGEINHQLKETDKPIQQIADDFGFPDQATFTKYYKRNINMTPTEYRSKNIV